MARNKQYHQFLRQCGLKVTSTRLLVLDVLMSSRTALSHGDILGKTRGSRLDKVTLYRTLDTFIKHDIAHKVASEDRTWLYALHPMDRNNIVHDDHAHFICDQCERIYCLPVQTRNGMPAPESEEGFVIRTHEYRLRGICPQCH